MPDDERDDDADRPQWRRLPGAQGRWQRVNVRDDNADSSDSESEEEVLPLDMLDPDEMPPSVNDNDVGAGEIESQHALRRFDSELSDKLKLLVSTAVWKSRKRIWRFAAAGQNCERTAYSENN